MKNKNFIFSFLYSFLCYIFYFSFIFLYSSIDNSQLNHSFSNSNNGQNSNFNTPENYNNQNAWQQVNSNNTIDLSTRQFNWQQRKIIKQKSYRIYTNLNIVIEDINDIISKFSLKVNDIKQVLKNFDNEVILKCNILDNKYNTLNDLMNYIAIWNDSINQFKKTVYYSLHKDFRKKIDAEGQNFKNIKNMIEHYNDSIFKIHNLEDILINSVNNLYSLQKTAIEYEEQAWIKYQQLDELINDVLAENIFLEINNCSENAILINTYLRGDFLNFFNQGMSNLSDSNILILTSSTN